MPSQTLQLPQGQADKLAWTQGGNVLSVSTKQGALHTCASSSSYELFDAGRPQFFYACSRFAHIVHGMLLNSPHAFLSDLVLLAHGHVIRYLMKVPCLCAGWDTKVAYLASLRELCVTDTTDNDPSIKIALESEPAFGMERCCICDRHNHSFLHACLVALIGQWRWVRSALHAV